MGHFWKHSSSTPYFGAQNVIHLCLLFRVKKREKLNRNSKTLACCIPTVFVSEEGRSARTETRARRRCCNNKHAYFNAPGLPRNPNSSCMHRTLSLVLAGVVQPASTLGSMKRVEKQERPRGSQRSMATMFIVAPLSGAWHRGSFPSSAGMGHQHTHIKASCLHCWAVAYMPIQTLLPVCCYWWFLLFFLTLPNIT